MILNGCAGIEHAYVSSPGANGAVETIRSKHCMWSTLDQKTNTYFEIQTTDLCIGSKYNYQESHIVLIGPYVVVPVPLIPMPIGIFELLFPPKKKAFAEEISVNLESKKGDLSFNPMEVILVNKNNTELKPLRFECTWYETDNNGNQHNFVYKFGIIPIKESKDGSTFCKITFDSYDWSFDLLINGLEANGQPILIPPIHFQRGSYWFLEVAP